MRLRKVLGSTSGRFERIIHGRQAYRNLIATVYSPQEIPLHESRRRITELTDR